MLLDIVGAISGWIAMLLFMWSPVSQLGSMAHKQLHRSDITAKSVAPTEVISEGGCDARKTQAEVINNGGSAQEKKRQRRQVTSVACR